jgi:hypothetical protein
MSGTDGNPLLEGTAPAGRPARPRRGQRAGAGRLQRAAPTRVTTPRRSSPTTSASGPPCPRSSTCRPRGPGDGLHPPGPSGGGARTPAGNWARSVTSWPDWRPRSSCWRTSASTRAKRPTTRPSWRSWSTPTTPTSTTPSASPTAATPRWSGPRCTCRVPPACSSRRRSRPWVAARRAGPAVRGRGRRGQGGRQARCAEGPAPPRGRPGGRGRHGLHLPGRPGSRHRRLDGRPRTASPSAPNCWPRAPRSCCPPTSWPSSPERPSAATASGARSARSVPTSPTAGRASTSGPRRWPPTPSSSPGRHRAVERAHGRLRGPAVLGRDAGVAEAMAACAPGYTVVGGGDSAAAVDELGLERRHQLHLHRGRCLARAARVRRPAGAGRTARGAQRPRSQDSMTVPPVSAAPPGARPLISGNWKMNLDHLEAIHAARDLGLRLQPADVGPSTCRCTRPSPTSARCSRCWRARGPGGPRRPELRDRGLRGLHRRGQPGDAGQAPCRVRHRRSLRARRPLRRDRRRGGVQAARRSCATA